MEISANKYKSDVNRPGFIFAGLKVVRGFVMWLIGFFTLTEEEQLQAGVNMRRKE